MHICGLYIKLVGRRSINAEKQSTLFSNRRTDAFFGVYIRIKELIVEFNFIMLGSVEEAEWTPFGKKLLPRLTMFSFYNVYLSRVVREPAFCICENKDADQLRGNREADQRLCVRYTDSTIPLVSKFKISSL